MGIQSVFRDVLKGAGGGDGPANRTIAVVEGAIGGAERSASLAALFPQVDFATLGADWSQAAGRRYDIVIIGVNAASSTEVEAAVRLGKARSFAGQVVVVLRDADVATMRALTREGIADVLPAPVSEPALALSLERLLHAGPTPARRTTGEVVAVVKAGGGVGATALSVQVGAMLAGRIAGGVCVADLDLQFGAADVYLDLAESLSVMDVLASGVGLAETPFRDALATHRSGLRLLAAPRDVTPLETLTPQAVDALFHGLKRDFALTLVDLPPVWTAWTNQVLTLADRIVMVTHLSVPHVQLVKRQLRILAAQGLDTRPLILACNGLSPDQTASVSVKAAERALGRAFDVVLPEDRKVMTGALNEGVEIAAVRRNTKLEKAVADLAGKVAATAPVMASAVASGRGA